jgi:hypothetical protein
LATLLAIDWDQQQLHLVHVRTQRKGMQVEWATDWDMGEDLSARSAEGIGKRLRDHLKDRHSTAGAAIVAIGREKVILKEIRYPVVSASEERAIVRFQATKDITEPPDLLEVDHVQRPHSGGGDRQALAVLARKDLLQAVRGLCKGAGIKLLGVAPRPFGAPYAVERSLQVRGEGLSPTRLQGVLTVGRRWAELCLFRGHELMLARSLPAGTLLTGEVKRSLAVFAAQNAADPDLAAPAVLHVFGSAEVVAALSESLSCRVEGASAVVTGDAVTPEDERQAPLAGAVGLAQRWALARSLPVNLAVAKKVQVSVTPGRKRGVIYGALAALVLICAIGGMYKSLSNRKAKIADLINQKNDVEKDIKMLAQDRADIDGLKEWDQTRIPWLDELYDLTARFPYEKGFRINHMSVEPVALKKPTKETKESKDAAKNPIVAKVIITGVSPSKEKDALVQQLREVIGMDSGHEPKHLQATIVKFPGGATHEFTIRIDVMKQPLSKYDTFLLLPPELARTASPAVGTKQSDDGDDQ